MIIILSQNQSLNYHMKKMKILNKVLIAQNPNDVNQKKVIIKNKVIKSNKIYLKKNLIK